VVIPPAIRVQLNAVRMGDGTITLIWRTKAEPGRTMVAEILIFIVLIAAGFSWPSSIIGALILLGIALAPAIVRLMRVTSILRAAVESIAGKHELKTVIRTGEIF
jgi:hypothetical protein